jgi:hypothetical protein
MPWGQLRPSGRGRFTLTFPEPSQMRSFCDGQTDGLTVEPLVLARVAVMMPSTDWLGLDATEQGKCGRIVEDANQPGELKQCGKAPCGAAPSSSTITNVSSCKRVSSTAVGYLA